MSLLKFSEDDDYYYDDDDESSLRTSWPALKIYFSNRCLETRLDFLLSCLLSGTT